jgi:hypothetical protein
MNNNAIIILEHNRPDYLNICLFSLTKLNKLNGWDIIVSIDGQSENYNRLKNIVNNYDYILWSWENNVSNKLHTIRSIEKAFTLYDKIIFAEGDLIFRTDTLQILDTIDYQNYTFVNLNGWLPHNGMETPYFYECRGNLIKNTSWNNIKTWLDNKSYLGCINPLANNIEPLILTEDYHSFEGFMARYTRDKLGKSYFVPTPCTLHFGVMGYSGIDLEVHNRIINGDPKTWMNNVLIEYSNRTSKHFWPKNFIYV